MKNDLAMSRFRTHNPDTMLGLVLVQFLALVVTAQLRVILAEAWARRLASQGGPPRQALFAQ